MKKLILLLLALVMAASFAACSSGGKANDNPSSFKTSDGYEIKADVLYVVFDPVSTLDRRDEIIKEHSLKTLSSDRLSSTYKVSLGHNADAQELSALKAALEAEKEVTGVTYDFVGKAPGVFY